MIQNKSATAVYDCSGTRYGQLIPILFRTTEENDTLEVRLLVWGRVAMGGGRFYFVSS